LALLIHGSKAPSVALQALDQFVQATTIREKESRDDLFSSCKCDPDTKTQDCLVRGVLAGSGNLGMLSLITSADGGFHGKNGREI